MSELLMHPMGGGTGSDDVTATAANVLTGKTAVTNDSDDEAIEGTMANNGAMDVTLTPSGNGTTSKEVAEGYYSGGTITADGAAAYSAGHSQGVTDADNRVNTASASYNSGYTNGYNAAQYALKSVGSGAWGDQNKTLTNNNYDIAYYQVSEAVISGSTQDSQNHPAWANCNISTTGTIMAKNGFGGSSSGSAVVKLLKGQSVTITQSHGGWESSNTGSSSGSYIILSF